MKKKYIVLLVILLALAGGIFYLATNLESIVKRVVHKYGSEVTGTDVNISGFSLSLKNGEGKISKLTVANPKDYSKPYLFSLEDITVKVDLKSITTDTIIIEKISVNKPVVTYEMLSLVKNNIGDVLQNVNSYSKSSEAKNANKKAESSTKTESSDPVKAGKKVVIKNISINSGELQALTKIQGKENSVDVKLPPITITGIGQGNNGASVIDAITRVMTQILTTASQTVVNSKIADLKGIAQENMDSVVNSAKDRVNNAIGGLFSK